MLFGTENPHGGDVYSRAIELDFSANINPLGTPPGVREAVMESIARLERYPDPFCRELVDAISEQEGVPKKSILCGNGAAELIFAYCGAVKPKKALVPVPTFCEYENALSLGGCAVERYLLREEDGFLLTEAFLDVLEAADVDLLMLCNPNNPTGLVIEPEMMGKICELCQRRNIWLFVDECFLDLTQGGEALSVKGLLQQYDNLLILKAFTKSYGMAGLRLGYCLSENRELLTAMSHQTQPWNVSIPAQAAGVAALKEGAFLENARAIVHRERPRLLENLTRLGLRPIPSKTNFILFHSGRELYAPLLERGIQIRRCENYPGLDACWYRIAVKLPEENTRLINALEEVLHG